MAEKIIHIKKFGEIVQKTRLAENPQLSQIEFYHYLLPYTDKSDDNIRKKMNAIENGKSKNIDIEFLEAFLEKYNCGLDYAFGLKTDYKTYDNEFLCKYFGLSEDTIIALHKIGKDKARNLNETMTYHNAKERNDIHNIKAKQHMDKDFANVFTTLLDFIFKDDKNANNKQLSKEAIFYLIFNYLASDAIIKDPKKKEFYYDNNTSEFTYLIDSENRIYGINVNDFFLDIVSKKILNTLDELRERYHKSNMPRLHVPGPINYSIRPASKE